MKSRRCLPLRLYFRLEQCGFHGLSTTLSLRNGRRKLLGAGVELLKVGEGEIHGAALAAAVSSGLRGVFVQS